MEQWKEYEEITKYIYEKLGEDFGVKIECYGNNCKVTGNSGVDHQIDVLTSHSDGIHTYKTAIECKYWDKNVNKDIVMKMEAILKDASINKGIIVSKKGFTPDGIAYAKFNNIGLVELREVTEEDWKGRIKDIKIELKILDPTITRFEILINSDSQSNIQEGQNLVDALDVISPDGTRKNIRKWIDEFHQELTKQEKDKPFEKIYEFEKGTKIHDSLRDTVSDANGLKIAGKLLIGTETFYIRGEEHVYMVMKVIFEEKSFTLLKDGRLVNRNS